MILGSIPLAFSLPVGIRLTLAGPAKWSTKFASLQTGPKAQEEHQAGMALEETEEEG